MYPKRKRQCILNRLFVARLNCRDERNPIQFVVWIHTLIGSRAISISEPSCGRGGSAIETRTEFPAAGALELDVTAGTRLLGPATRYIIPSYIGQCLLFVSSFIFDRLFRPRRVTCPCLSMFYKRPTTCWCTFAARGFLYRARGYTNVTLRFPLCVHWVCVTLLDSGSKRKYDKNKMFSGVPLQNMITDKKENPSAWR